MFYYADRAGDLGQATINTVLSLYVYWDLLPNEKPFLFLLPKIIRLPRHRMAKFMHGAQIDSVSSDTITATVSGRMIALFPAKWKN